MEKLKITGSRKNIMQTEYYEIISDLLELAEVQKLKQFRHHIRTNRFQHCLNVSYYNYRLSRLLGLDAVSAARAGLLHDLYFYDTKKYCQEKHKIGHCENHPSIALENAERLLDLNDKERDIISNHMWPMTKTKPKYAETWLITVTDKYCALIEFMLPHKKESKALIKRHAYQKSPL